MSGWLIHQQNHHPRVEILPVLEHAAAAEAFLFVADDDGHTFVLPIATFLRQENAHPGSAVLLCVPLRSPRLEFLNEISALARRITTL